MKSRIILATVLLALAMSPIAFAAKPDKGLPPGLKKNAAKGHSLPPGWEKKLKKGEVLDKSIVEAGVVVKATSPTNVTIKVDDRLLRLDPITRKILEIIK